MIINKRKLKFNNSDHYPFGSIMSGRGFNAGTGKFGFQGQMKTDEWSGSGNHYTAEFWEYDPRLGRRYNPDPVVKPWRSPYDAFDNNPTNKIDPNGADDYFDKKGNLVGKTASGSAVKVTTLTTDQFNKIVETDGNFIETLDKSSKLFTEFSLKNKENQAMANNILKYYYMEGGFGGPKEADAEVYQWYQAEGVLAEVWYGKITLGTEGDKIHRLFSDKHNIMAEIAHEKEHLDGKDGAYSYGSYSTGSILGHLNCYLATANHSSFQSTTLAFKQQLFNKIFTPLWKHVLPNDKDAFTKAWTNSLHVLGLKFIDFKRNENGETILDDKGMPILDYNSIQYKTGVNNYMK